MAGDVHLIVNIEPHKIFTRIGADLYMKKEISLVEALTGISFEITHLDNHKIKVVNAPNEIVSPSKSFMFFEKIFEIQFFSKRKLENL